MHKQHTLVKQYEKFLLEANIEGMDNILNQAIEDEDVVESILALNRKYEENNNLTPTEEQKQKSLQRLQKLFSSDQETDKDSTPEQLSPDIIEEKKSNLLLENTFTKQPEKKANIFQKATLVAEIVDQCHTDNTFGTVKCQKVIYLCEMHAQLRSLQTTYYRYPAGPFNYNLFHGTINFIENKNWFKKVKKDIGARFLPADNQEEYSQYFASYWGKKKDEIYSVIDLLRPLYTHDAELVATLYAVWNDLILEGVGTEEYDIVQRFYQWNISKEKFLEKDCYRTLAWMKKVTLIPIGFGKHTQIKKRK